MLTYLLILCSASLIFSQERNCEDVDDCELFEICMNSKCEPDESCDSRCPAGKICLNGTCIYNPNCERSADCRIFEVCRDGLCRKQVEECGGRLCTEGLICVGGSCRKDPFTLSTETDEDENKVNHDDNNENSHEEIGDRYNGTKVTNDERRSRCPEKWKRYKGECHRLLNETLDYATSKARCESLGGHPVVFNTFEELLHVNRMARNHPFWIGLIRERNKFKWTDGRELKFAFWNLFEPNGGECVLAEKNTGLWKDLDCSMSKENFAIVCEKPLLL